MTGLPWIKFYPADWRSDPALRLCSRAARGTWIDMLSIMHEAEPYGELRVGPVVLDAASLAKLLGERVEDIRADLAELEANGVFSRRKNGVIYSRRMESDENRRRKMRENGKLGGNPSLSKQTEKQGLDNQPDNLGDITQRPEARDQSPEAEAEEERKKRARERAIALGLEFDETFWPAYPHKVGKPKAVTAFKNARDRASLNAIMAGLARYKSSKPPDRQWLNPATFLNQDRWADQPAADGVIGNGHGNGRRRATFSDIEAAADAELERLGYGAVPDEHSPATLGTRGAKPH